MNTITIDRAGRVVIPKLVRDELGLDAGDLLQIDSNGESLTLRPVRTKSPLSKEHGIWVYHGGGKLSVTETSNLIRETREKRDRKNLGVGP